VFWISLQFPSGTFLVLRRNEWDMKESVFWSFCKLSLISSDFNETLIFSTYFRRIPKRMKFYENSSIGSRVAPCGPKDGRTDKMKLIFAFHNFANSPKNRQTILNVKCKTFITGNNITFITHCNHKLAATLYSYIVPCKIF
jgi:hypothetical protein